MRDKERPAGRIRALTRPTRQARWVPLLLRPRTNKACRAMGSHLRHTRLIRHPGPPADRACSPCNLRLADPGEDRTRQDALRVTSLARNSGVMRSTSQSYAIFTIHHGFCRGQRLASQTALIFAGAAVRAARDPGRRLLRKLTAA